MGWLSNVFSKISSKKGSYTYADILNGNVPVFSTFGTNVYASDVVQQAISCIVSEMKKLTPQHIKQQGTDIAPVNSDIQKMLDNPNPFMTTSDLLEKVTWQLLLNYNAFLVPLYEENKDSNGTIQRKYHSLYPIQPMQVDFIEDASNKLFVKLYFANGTDFTIKYSDIIHIKKNYSVNDFMGGNEQGKPDNEALLETLQLNKDLLKGVSSAMKSSFAINGVIKYQTMLDDGKTEVALKELERKLKNSESGFLPLDLKAEFIPIKKDTALVDATTLKFIDEKILRNYGVPLCILTGDYTKDQYEAFYQKTLEPIIISLCQAFTKSIFNDNQKSRGNKIQFYPKDLIFMSISQTLEMIRLLGDSGALYENEKRQALGLKPLPELVGVRMQSLNYVNVELAGKYQAGEDNNDSNKEEKGE